MLRCVKWIEISRYHQVTYSRIADSSRFCRVRCVHTLPSLQLLRLPELADVEKIKNIGSTYMAAAGLQTGEDNAHVGPPTHRPSLTMSKYPKC